MQKSRSWLFLILLPLLVLSACQENKTQAKETASPLTSFEASLTAQDTLVVKKLVDKFFGQIVRGEAYKSADMLYECVRDKGINHYVPLSNEAKDKALEVLELIPIKNYELQYMKFEAFNKNELGVKLIIDEGQDAITEKSVDMIICPLYLTGAWVLSMHK